MQNHTNAAKPVALVHKSARHGPRVRAALLLGSALALPTAAMAQSWDGSASTDYNTAANWSTNAVPTASDAVIVDSVTNAPIVGTGQTGSGGTISVGVAGTGQLSIQQGGDLVLGSLGNFGILSVGGSQTTTATGGNGTVRATGVGSTISAPGGLTLGVAIAANSVGLLEVLDGALISSTSGAIGTAAGSNGVFTISGAGSRWDVTSGAGGVSIGSTTSDTALGTLNVLDGATVAYPGGVGWTLGHGGTINVAGAGSQLQGPIAVTSRGAISITSGGIAAFTQLNLGGTTQPASLVVSGTGSQLTVESVGISNAQPNTLVVSAGGQLFTDEASLPIGTATVTGAGSLWQIAADSNNATNIGSGALVASLNVLDGGRINSLNRFNYTIGQSANVRLAGPGSVLELAASISIGASNAGQPTGSFVIEDGASLITHGANDNGLGFGVRRDVTIRNGGSWIMDGGPNAGLQIETANLLVDGGTLSAQGNVLIGQRFSGTILTLRDADFSARELSVGTVTGNLVQIGAGAGDPAAPAGAFDVDVVSLNNGNQLVLNHSERDYVIRSVIQGSAGANGDPLIAHLAGDTIFTGANGGYSGLLSITGGTVRFNGSLGNTVARATVDSEGGLATVGGSGAFGGTLSVLNGTLAPGNSPGTLTIGQNLVLGANAVLSFELGAPGGTAGLDSDLINVTGNLTLDGTLDVIDAGAFGAGLYRLINYGGTLTDNGLEVGTLPGAVSASDVTVQTSIANQVNLLVDAPPAPTSFPFWDGDETVANGQIAGGTGTWTATRTNWTTAAATANGAYNPIDLLIFTGPVAGEVEEEQAQRLALAAPHIVAATPSTSAGTVTIDASAGAITVENGMQFAVTGYTLTGDDIVLAATEPCGECTPLPGQTIVRVGDGTGASTGFVTTIESRLVGESGLLKTDRGTLILSGANSYSGGTEIADGMLQGDATSLQGDIEIGSDGTLLFTQDDAGTYEGALSGRGIVAKQGAGMLRLTGESFAFDGTTALTEGELAIDGTLGSALSTLEANAGATLSGAGRIGGTLVVEDATVSPGGNQIERVELRLAAAAAAVIPPANPVGLLTIDGDFSLTGASILAFQLDDPAGEAGIASDLINVGGNLTLDGTLDVTDVGGFGAGIYRLINYGGTLTDNGLVVGITPDGFTPADLTVQTSVASQVNLLVATPVTSFNFWDGANLASDGTVNGGTATWRADTTNWTIADSARNGVVDPAQLLIFAGTAGTVTVDNAGGQVRATVGLQFATNGYRIEGGAIALDGASATMRVGDGTAVGADFTATIDSVLTGSASLEKTDLGTLVLSGANTFTGGTRIRAGTVQIASDSALGAAPGAATIDGGILRTTAAITSARNFTIGSSGGTIDSGTNALTLSGTFSGSGNLRLVGSGARAFSGNSSNLFGRTSLTAGSLVLTGSLGGLLSVSAPATLTGTGRAGFLDLSGTFSPGAGAGNTATFTLTGDFVVRAGSTLQVDVATSGAADRVEVGGRALLEGGTVAVSTLDPEVNYTDGTVYRIVNAAGGLTGTFAALTETSAFLDFTLGYDPTGAFLTTTVIRQFPDVAETFNQTEAATALKDLGRVSGSNALATYNTLLLLGAEPARAAFDATSGEIYPTLLASRQRAGLALAGRIAMRGRASGNEGLALWGGVLGDRSHVDGDGNGARSTADSFGWESGLDYRGPDNQWALGFGGGWQEGDITLAARGSRAKTDAWHIGGYARYGTGGTGFSLVASLAHSNADTSVTRQIGFGTVSRTAVSNVDLRTTAASADLRFGLGDDALAFGPLASVEHASTRLGRIAETGAGALNLSGAGKREGWTRVGVGAFAHYGLGSGFADVALRYVHRSRGTTQLDLAMEGSPTAHAVRAAGGSRGGVRVDASSEFSIGKRWAISGNLGASHADKEGQIDGSLRLSYRF